MPTLQFVLVPLRHSVRFQFERERPYQAVRRYENNEEGDTTRTAIQL